MENGDDGDIRLKNELSKKIDVYPNQYMIRKNFIYKIVVGYDFNWKQRSDSRITRWFG